jgi:hypothetical protein
MPEAYNPSTNTKKSPLEEISKQFLNEKLAINRYSFGNKYGLNNPDALSDGDEFGKGENNGQVGSKSDIHNRIDNVGRNRFNDGKKYPDF